MQSPIESFQNKTMLTYLFFRLKIVCTQRFEPISAEAAEGMGD